VVDEHAGSGRLPADRNLLTRIDQGKLGAAERSRGGMEVDVVRHRVGIGIDQRHLDVVALMHHHHRPRHRAVEGHRLEGGALVVDDDIFLLDLERELHDLGPSFVACSCGCTKGGATRSICCRGSFRSSAANAGAAIATVRKAALSSRLRRFSMVVIPLWAIVRCTTIARKHRRLVAPAQTLGVLLIQQNWLLGRKGGC
jgi:hypothetical protein